MHYSDAYVELYCESIGGELYKKFRVEQIITSEKTQENTIFTEEERKSINEVSYSNGEKTTWIKSGKVYDAITKIYPKVTLQCLENTAIRMRSAKQFPRIFSAVLLSFFPIDIAARGAPPEPASIAKALISIRIGVNNPTPVNAAAPTPEMCPI